jgi:hypothetical protein
MGDAGVHARDAPEFPLNGRRRSLYRETALTVFQRGHCAVDNPPAHATKACPSAGRTNLLTSAALRG